VTAACAKTKALWVLPPVRETVDRTLKRLGPDECYAQAAEVFGDRPDVALDPGHLCVGNATFRFENCIQQ